MENHNYPVARGFYRNLPMPQMGPPDPHFMNGLYPPANEAQSSLFNALEIVRLGKWYILSVSILVFTAVAIFTFTADPVYEAKTMMLVNTSAGDQNRDPSFTKFQAAENTDLANETLILQQSMEIAERTARRLVEMRTLPETGAPLSILSMSTSIPQLAQLLQEDYLAVKPANDANADAIEVRASGASAQEAALLANVYAEEYVEQTKEVSRERITARRIFLEQQSAEKKAELEEIENQLAKYMTEHGTAALDDQARLTVQSIASMQAMLEDSRIELSMRESALATLESELAEIQPEISRRLSSGTDAELERVNARIEELRARKEEILRRTPEAQSNPSSDDRLIDINTELTQLQARSRALADQLVDEYIGSGGVNPNNQGGVNMQYVADLKRQIAEHRIEINSQRSKVSSLNSRLEDYNSRLRTIPVDSYQLARLEREQQTAAQLYNTLQTKLNEVRIEEQANPGFVRIIRRALPPEGPESPKKAMNLFMGLMLGLMLGVGAAIARSKFDTRVYSPEDLSVQDIAMLGVVPDMRQLIKKEFNKRLKIDYEGREVSTSLAALLAPMSPIAEAYRRLYIKLQFSRDDLGIQNLMITSPKAGAGKSTTTLNLAFTTAQAGKRTLVIDADLRRPSLHDKLGLPEGPSLLELLSEEASRWDSERFYTGIENVYVITGIPVSQPAELLGSRKMLDLVDRFRSEFDVILFDTPPVLGAADPVLLSRQVDGVIVVASSDGTDMASLKQTIDELKSVNANILGTVLNRFDPSGNYGYRNTYGYSYGDNNYVTS